MPRNDQPFRTSAYNTDQFTDPVTGLTVHDDGTPTYTQPQTGVVYTKNRYPNGLSSYNESYRIELVSINWLQLNDGVQFVLLNNGIDKIDL